MKKIVALLTLVTCVIALSIAPVEAVTVRAKSRASCSGVSKSKAVTRGLRKASRRSCAG